MKEEIREKIVRLRRQLHARPELSMQEQETARTLRRFLRDHAPSFEIADHGSWFYALKKGSGQEKGAIAFRADMDALPIPETISLPYGSQREGVSHKCGHDGHCAALCALALELEGETLPRDVILLFQPGEETGQGALLCAEIFSEQDIRAVYAFHNLSGYPAGTLVYRRGLTQPASEGLAIRLLGRPSHASAPEEGINPAAALADLTLSAGEMAARPHRGMALCTVVGLRCGSGDYGVSAGEGEIRLTLRAEEETEMEEMERALRDRAGELAGHCGARMEYSISDRFPETRNDDACLDKVLRCARTLQIPSLAMEKLWRASEDFGVYTKRCPGAMFYLGNGEDYPPLHTPEYDFPDALLPVAADLFAALARES